MTAQVLKIGQVWRLKKDKEGTLKVAIIAVSWNKVFVSGTIDEIEPEWTNEYLLNNYEPDGDYY